MAFENSLQFAQSLDQTDRLAGFRDRFLIPQHEGKDVLYFTGNSLGLQPKATRESINQELDDWATYGVEGHFLAKRPWFAYHGKYRMEKHENNKEIEANEMISCNARKCRSLEVVDQEQFLAL